MNEIYIEEDPSWYAMHILFYFVSTAHTTEQSKLQQYYAYFIQLITLYFDLCNYQKRKCSNLSVVSFIIQHILFKY